MRTTGNFGLKYSKNVFAISSGSTNVKGVKSNVPNATSLHHSQLMTQNPLHASRKASLQPKLNLRRSDLMLKKSKQWMNPVTKSAKK